jgi:uncharacterized membrane protein YdjX (TVP38/TMEM64 family)
VQTIQKRIVAAFAVAVIVIGLGLLAHSYTSIDWLVDKETLLRAHVQRSPGISWMIGFAIYVCLSLVPGTSGKAVIIGWLFGFWSAVLMVDGALTIAALITFSGSRYLFREAVEEKLGVHLVYLNRKLENAAWFYLLTLRLLHTPFSMINYGAGATQAVSLRTFWWTTQIGVLPGTMVFVFAGTRIPSLSTISQDGVFAILDGTLIAALAATIVVPFLLKWIVTRVSRRRL